MTRILVNIAFLGLLIGCINPNDKYFVEILGNTDKIYLYKSINNEFCLFKSFDYAESQELVAKIKIDLDIEIQRKFLGDYRLELYQGDSLICNLKVGYGETPFVNFSNAEKGFGFRLNYNFGRFIEETSANN